MSCIVFIGPTITCEDARRELDAPFFPPAAQGDVYRAALSRPRAIGIVDGYFEQVPAVWHKEILWVMSQGIHVFGSSSMGALRGAELASFGMVGVGRVFEAYRDGSIEDDDEVALAHAPAEYGYQHISEPMVNIRATLEHALACGIIGEAVHDALLRAAKGHHYRDRAYPAILRAARLANVEHEAELDLLDRWLVDHRVDQKKDDAIALLRAMAAFQREPATPLQVNFEFESTQLWQHATRLISPRIDDTSAISKDGERVLEELRRDPVQYAAAVEAALSRSLAVKEARRDDRNVDAQLLARQINEFRHYHELFETSALDDWLASNALAREHFIELMVEEVRCQVLKARFESSGEAALLDYLRATGEYAGLMARAQQRARPHLPNASNDGFKRALD